MRKEESSQGMDSSMDHMNFVWNCMDHMDFL